MSSSSSITLKGCYTVTPMEPTWRGCLPLTEFDQLGITTYTPILFYYRPPQNWLTPPTKIATTLKHSLSKVLVHFYPLAGRLRSKGNKRFELECNAKGVQFIEAESSLTLSDLGDFSSSSDNYRSYLFPQVDYTLPIQDRPLLIVQLTNFKCGDISISLLLSHAVIDGQSGSHFIAEWAQLARGEPLKRIPFLDRNILHNKEPCNCVNEWKFDKPPLLLENSDSNVEEERKKKTMVAIIHVSKAQVERLRKITNESWNKPSNERNYTIYETITGHIWRSACIARGLKIDQPTVFGVVVDFRSRVKPSLPKKYFGNAIVNVVATSLAGDLMSKPLGYASSRIKEAIEKVNDEYVRSTLTDYKKRDYDRTMMHVYTVPFYRNPNLGALSWMMFSYHKFDFGWGEEVYMIPGIHTILEGETYILPSSQVDGTLVCFICLQEVYMSAFKKHFYEGIIELDSLSKL
ncbi:unnamed protein product [Vicia faba]|uniref:Uncharacterized protein n=1 Tax=Vicia faba TaxID=3906 RepID=A0AAV1A759_VICFA|nr:unnamed protein product [Vicia faba]